MRIDFLDEKDLREYSSHKKLENDESNDSALIPDKKYALVRLLGILMPRKSSNKEFIYRDLEAIIKLKLA